MQLQVYYCNGLDIEMNVQLYQICYSLDTCSKCKVQVIDNSLRTEPYPALESRTIVDHFDSVPACDYVGYLSWKFEWKRPMAVDRIITRIQQDEFQHDVYSFFSGMTARPNMWVKGETWHPSMVRMAETIFAKIGFHFDLRNIPPMPVVYQSAHVTRYDVYKDFVDNWLRPFVNVLENDPELQGELNKRAPYRVGETQHNKPEQLKKAMGQSYYTMHPFIAERVFSTYLAFHPKKIKHFC